MLNFDGAAVKHGAENIQNATRGFLTALKCTEFVLGRIPGPHWGAYSAPQAP